MRRAGKGSASRPPRYDLGSQDESQGAMIQDVERRAQQLATKKCGVAGAVCARMVRNDQAE